MSRRMVPEPTGWVLAGHSLLHLRTSSLGLSEPTKEDRQMR